MANYRRSSTGPQLLHDAYQAHDQGGQDAVPGHRPRPSSHPARHAAAAGATRRNADAAAQRVCAQDLNTTQIAQELTWPNIPESHRPIIHSLVKAGVDGAQLIWSMWLEEEHEEGNGLATHGGQTPLEDGVDNIKSVSKGGTSAEYTMQRLIRDAHDEQIVVTATSREKRMELLAHPEVII